MPEMWLRVVLRVWMQEDTGFDGHPFTDRTDTQSPAVLTNALRYRLVESAVPPMVDSSKPVYKIPSTAEILATPSSGYRAVGSFSGCGGSSLGLVWAGIKMIRAYEFDPIAARSYAANFDTPVVVSDIREVTVSEVLSACELQVGELDIFEGSPPCSKFSMAGRREGSWNRVTGSDSTIQQANVEDLFFDWIKLLRGLQPRVAVAENVMGLSIGSAKGHLKLIVAGIRDAGYRVQVWELDAQWLGVPQRRRRLVFVAVRNDLVGFPVRPVPLPYRYTVADALPHLINDSVFNGLHGSIEERARSYEPAGTHVLGTVTGHATPGGDWSVGTVRVAQSSLPTLGQKYSTTDKVLGTLAAAGSTTRAPGKIKTGDGADGVIRRFTISELRRLCGFPDDFVLVGTDTQQWARLGNAVMPLMYKAVGESLVGFLKGVDSCPKVPDRVARVNRKVQRET